MLKAVALSGLSVGSNHDGAGGVQGFETGEMIGNITPSKAKPAIWHNVEGTWQIDVAICTPLCQARGMDEVVWGGDEKKEQDPNWPHQSL